MKVVFTASAFADLDEILDYTADVWPAQFVPLIRYPFRLLYRVEGGTIEVLHIHHAARDAP